MNKWGLFRLLILRYYKKNWLKLIFTCLGISLGLALFITTRSYSDTILNYVNEQTNIKSFSNVTIKSKVGKISFVEYQKITNFSIIKHAVAKAESVAKVLNHHTNQFESLRIVGVDLINIPADGPIESDVKEIESLFSQPYHGISNNLNQLSKGGKLVIKLDQNEISLPVLDTAPFDFDKENILFIDLAGYFNDISKQYWLNEIDIKIDRQDIEKLNLFLKNINPDLYALEPGEHAKNTKKISDSFSINLIYLSSFAILVSLLISYQFFNFISTSRQKVYEKCLALGMKQKQLIGIIIVEMGIVFFISYILAIFFGIYLGKLSLFAIKETVSLLYYPIHPNDIIVSTFTLFIAFLIGGVSYSLNCLEPIIAVRNKKSFFRERYDQISTQSIKKLSFIFIFGLILIWLSCFYIKFFINITSSIYGGYINMMVFIIGIFCLIPIILYITSKKLRQYKSPVLTASLLSIEKFPVKNFVTVSALSLAFCLFLSLSFFISSFRSTVIDWIEYSNWADIYIYNESNKVAFEVPIDRQLLNEMIQHEDVLIWDPISHYEILINSQPTSVIASKYEVLNTFEKRLKLFNNSKIKDPFQDVYVSESFFQKTGKGINDTLKLVGDKAQREVKIRDIFYSYGTDRGVIQIDSKLANSLFDDKGVHGLGVKLSKSIKETTFFNDFKEVATAQGILLSSNEGLRDRALETFDQTFKITWMLAIISGIIATLALINYVSIALIDRSKELIQIRSIGASHRFIIFYSYIQVGLITCIALIISMIMTLGILHILIETINKPIFGWTISVHYSIKPIGIIIGIAVFISFITLLSIYKLKQKEFEKIRIGQND